MLFLASETKERRKTVHTDGRLFSLNSQSPRSWGNGRNFFYKDYDAPVDESPPTIVPFVASSNFSTGIPAKASQVQDTRRTRSPPSLASDEEILRNSINVRGR